MSEQKEEKTNDVRRKLLKAAIYVPPVILGTMIATPRNAMGVVVSCSSAGGGPKIKNISSGSNACCPCVIGSSTYNLVQCQVEKDKATCLASCGTAAECAGVIGQIPCSDFCSAACGTTLPAGCAGPCTCRIKKNGRYQCN